MVKIRIEPHATDTPAPPLGDDLGDRGDGIGMTCHEDGTAGR